MNQMDHKAVFMEEARELLADLESALLELEDAPPRYGDHRAGVPRPAHHQGIGGDVRIRSRRRLHP
jgi:hypothetical protein